jgi:hypothetical protein
VRVLVKAVRGDDRQSQRPDVRLGTSQYFDSRSGNQNASNNVDVPPELPKVLVPPPKRPPPVFDVLPKPVVLVACAPKPVGNREGSSEPLFARIPAVPHPAPSVESPPFLAQKMSQNVDVPVFVFAGCPNPPNVPVFCWVVLLFWPKPPNPPPNDILNAFFQPVLRQSVLSCCSWSSREAFEVRARESGDEMSRSESSTSTKH